jgi:myo-inositol-hexaphosphate 3-phosphohydrolase
VKLRGKVYGYRHYDFKNNEFSEYLTGKIENLEEYYIINSGGEWIDLAKAVTSDKFELFIRDYSPMYMRPSEAEINFDKKSCFC